MLSSLITSIAGVQSSMTERGSVLSNLLQPYCNPLAERFVQPFYSVAAYALQEVRVAVHRLRDGRVPE